MMLPIPTSVAIGILERALPAATFEIEGHSPAQWVDQFTSGKNIQATLNLVNLQEGYRVRFQLTIEVESQEGATAIHYTYRTESGGEKLLADVVKETQTMFEVSLT
jgi:hypothetical protein